MLLSTLKTIPACDAYLDQGGSAVPYPDPQEFSKHFGLALMLEAIGQIPVLGVLTKAAW